jgi:hypothetical protein
MQGRAAAEGMGDPVPCREAQRVVKEMMTLMSRTARDESDQLRALVSNGWQTPDDRLIVIRGFSVGHCRSIGPVTQVVVSLSILGRLAGSGSADQLAYQAQPGTAQQNFAVLYDGGTPKVRDITSFESHVLPDYAIRMLDEFSFGEPAAAGKMKRIAASIRNSHSTASGSSAPSGR